MATSITSGTPLSSASSPFELKNLNLEHKIPISIGGSLVNIKNLRLFCHECHKIKTRKDIIVIKFLKKLKLFNEVFIFIKPEKLHNIYIYLYNLLEEGESNFRDWSHGENGIDYEQIQYKGNWEVTKENGTTNNHQNK
ncbi:MAG: HNH endonuclease signature motif containing protein [Nanoarchaeota archaeon]